MQDTSNTPSTESIPPINTKEGIESKEAYLAPSEDKSFRETVEAEWQINPKNPRNWSPARKWTTVLLVSVYTFITPLGSSMIAPGLPDISLRYDITNASLLALTLSIYLLAFAVGPLIIGPLSEMYGRAWVLHIANILFIAFNLGCAFAPATGSLIGLRFLAGLAGGTPVAVGGGCVSDLFEPKQRASPMAIYLLGPLTGPVIGPIAGGFVVETIGLKWVFIIISIAAAVIAMVAIPLMRETYAPVIRMRLLPASASSDEKKAMRAIVDPAVSQGSRLYLLWLNFSRPAVLLTRSFLCFVLSLYMAIVYGMFYLMFTTFPGIFQTVYGFNTGTTGLAYIGLGIGFVAATICNAKFGDKVYAKLVERNGGKPQPELRMPPLIFGSLFVPIGLFWYGWSVQARIHWIMAIIGTTIFGFAMQISFLPIMLYLVDAFTFAASALSAAAVFRSVFGCVFPLFGAQMYAALGDGGGNSLLAGISIVIGIPFPIWIYFQGEKIRKRNPLNR